MIKNTSVEALFYREVFYNIDFEKKNGRNEFFYYNQQEGNNEHKLKNQLALKVHCGGILKRLQCREEMVSILRVYTELFW